MAAAHSIRALCMRVAPPGNTASLVAALSPRYHRTQLLRLLLFVIGEGGAAEHLLGLLDSCLNFFPYMVGGRLRRLRSSALIVCFWMALWREARAKA